MRGFYANRSHDGGAQTRWMPILKSNKMKVKPIYYIFHAFVRLSTHSDCPTPQNMRKTSPDWRFAAFFFSFRFLFVSSIEFNTRNKMQKLSPSLRYELTVRRKISSRNPYHGVQYKRTELQSPQLTIYLMRSRRNKHYSHWRWRLLNRNMRWGPSVF